jgi:hypothetical protein
MDPRRRPGPSGEWDLAGPLCSLRSWKNIGDCSDCLLHLMERRVRTGHEPK